MAASESPNACCASSSSSSSTTGDDVVFRDLLIAEAGAILDVGPGVVLTLASSSTGTQSTRIPSLSTLELRAS